MGAFSFLNKEIAIDLGTANTVIIYNDKVVVDEPSIVAIQRDTKKIIAVGKKAMMMHGKTHENIKTIRPLRDGVIADFQAAEHMMRAGTKPFCKASMQITASTDPDALVVCPVSDLVDETGGICSPNRRFIAWLSLTSLLGVPVPCALM